MQLRDVDCIEFMEAFAVTIAKFLRDRDVDPERVNVAGGHLAKGHPMGASGGILLVDAARRARGARCEQRASWSRAAPPVSVRQC